MAASSDFRRPIPPDGAAGAYLDPFAPAASPPIRYHEGAAAFERLVSAGLPAPVTDALAGPAGRGTLGVLHDPLAFDPVVYVAASARLGEVVYVGRTYNLPQRIARHRRAMQEVGGWYPDLWAAVRVDAPDAPHVEEGLIRTFQEAGHAAHLIVRRSANAGGELVSNQQADALRRHGFARE